MDVLLIDGKNFCWRHGWTRRMLRTSYGFPTGVLFGVLSGLMRLNRYYPEAAIIFCWDGEKTSESWRHKLAKTYKATRTKKAKGEKPQEVLDVYKQIPALKLLLARLGFLQIELPTLEADDLIGVVSRTLSKKMNRVFIYSSDKDFFQLIDKNVYLIRDMKADKHKKCAPITEKKIKAEFHVSPRHWVDYRSFVGDKSDDIHKPIKGLGPKTVLAILAEGTRPSKNKCKSEKVKDCWDDVMVNYKLTKIVRRADDSRLPSVAKLHLGKIVKQLKKAKPEQLFRSKEGKSKDAYKYLIKTLVKYQLETLLSSRHALFSLP